MQHKGFSKTPQELLIKGWLLPDNRKHYKFKSNTFVLESLPMLLNMWVALASQRLALGKDKQESTLSALTLIAALDIELIKKSQMEAGRWLMKLCTDEQFYVNYCKRLLGLVKDAIASGKYDQLNGCIQNTWEYKQWMEEAGYLLSTTTLINGWLHPLSEFKTIDGEEILNFWAVASVLTAAATERNDCGDKETCIKQLIRLGVLDVETDFNTRLTVASLLDAEYLEIVSQTKEALDKDSQK